MQEGTIMEIVKWFIGLLLTMMIISISIFLFQVGNINSFKQEVNYQIERQGGLTETAVANINAHSEAYYGGQFTVQSDKLNQKVNYGETVDYIVTGEFEIRLFPMPNVTLEFGGSSLSQVR